MDSVMPSESSPSEKHLSNFYDGESGGDNNCDQPPCSDMKLAQSKFVKLFKHLLRTNSDSILIPAKTIRGQSFNNLRGPMGLPLRRKETSQEKLSHLDSMPEFGSDKTIFPRQFHVDMNSDMNNLAVYQKDFRTLCEEARCDEPVSKIQALVWHSNYGNFAKVESLSSSGLDSSTDYQNYNQRALVKADFVSSPIQDKDTEHNDAGPSLSPTKRHEICFTKNEASKMPSHSDILFMNKTAPENPIAVLTGNGVTKVSMRNESNCGEPLAGGQSLHKRLSSPLILQRRRNRSLSVNDVLQMIGIEERELDMHRMALGSLMSYYADRCMFAKDKACEIRDNSALKYRGESENLRHADAIYDVNTQQAASSHYGDLESVQTSQIERLKSDQVFLDGGDCNDSSKTMSSFNDTGKLDDKIEDNNYGLRVNMDVDNEIYPKGKMQICDRANSGVEVEVPCVHLKERHFEGLDPQTIDQNTGLPGRRENKLNMFSLSVVTLWLIQSKSRRSKRHLALQNADLQDKLTISNNVNIILTENSERIETVYEYVQKDGENICSADYSPICDASEIRDDNIQRSIISQGKSSKQFCSNFQNEHVSTDIICENVQIVTHVSTASLITTEHKNVSFIAPDDINSLVDSDKGEPKITENFPKMHEKVKTELTNLSFLKSPPCSHLSWSDDEVFYSPTASQQSIQESRSDIISASDDKLSLNTSCSLATRRVSSTLALKEIPDDLSQIRNLKRESGDDEQDKSNTKMPNDSTGGIFNDESLEMLHTLEGIDDADGLDFPDRSHTDISATFSAYTLHDGDKDTGNAAGEDQGLGKTIADRHHHFRLDVFEPLDPTERARTRSDGNFFSQRVRLLLQKPSMLVLRGSESSKVTRKEYGIEKKQSVQDMLARLNSPKVVRGNSITSKTSRQLIRDSLSSVHSFELPVTYMPFRRFETVSSHQPCTRASSPGAIATSFWALCCPFRMCTTEEEQDQ